MFRTKLVGTGHRPIEAQEIVLNLVEGDEVELEAEPENPYDPNAIKIIVDEVHVGYVAASERTASGYNLAQEIIFNLPARAVVTDGAGTRSPVLVVTPLEAEDAGPAAA